MPLKKEYVGHSLPLQQLYIAVMAEKIFNELNRTFPKAPESLKQPTDEFQEQPRSQSSLSVPEAEKITGLSTETTNTSITSNHHHSNMLFHDRMDLLEQELYRVKKRSKKKLEDLQSYQDDMAQQLNELISWKSQSDRARKSERVWMLMLMFCVIFSAVSLRTFFL
ncbi:hypothetical protein EDC96DRAFT_444249 [Choanephora cucurbitarum]|nr:hypothetical protein EDC96DRAFT_444249 [Choanephora cucurbitarum]